MGFVSFVKRLFGAEEKVTETSQVVEPVAAAVQAVEIAPVVEQSPIVETQITDAVTTAEPVVNTAPAVSVSDSITDTVTIKEDAKSNKKVVIRKRTYKPKANVTKKSAHKGGLSNNG